MIEAEKLTKWYGPTLALDQVDLTVDKGQIVGFLGPNGAGKTTTLRILTCFLPATSGRARVNGHDVFAESAAVRKSIGYLPENTPLYPEMRVDEELHYFGRLHGMDRRTRVRRIDELSARCGLNQIRGRLIGNLSKGNRQRVGLAQAMLHDPPVLILDEPTIGLDPTQITEVRKLIVELAGQKTILLSTHILPEVERTCQRVVIIASGSVVAAGTPDELKAKVRSASRVLVEVKANPVDLTQAFEALPEVAAVQAEGRGGWCHAAVTANHQAADVREAMGRVLVERQWAVRELRYEAASLEEFFVQITSTQKVEAA